MRAKRASAVTVSVAVIGDHRMRRINRDYHHADETTDVLAFPDDDPSSGFLGEVLVCAPEAFRQADRRSLPPLTELLLYAVHGTLHLLGEEDHTPIFARRMRRLEMRILGMIGYPLPDRHLGEV